MSSNLMYAGLGMAVLGFGGQIFSRQLPRASQVQYFLFYMKYFFYMALHKQFVLLNMKMEIARICIMLDIDPFNTFLQV
jgi:hypothetical protein